jgi:hypothetical protein
VEDNKYYNVSETGSVSVLRWMGQDKPTQLGPLERASLNHWTTYTIVTILSRQQDAYNTENYVGVINTSLSHLAVTDDTLVYVVIVVLFLNEINLFLFYASFYVYAVKFLYRHTTTFDYCIINRLRSS